MLRVEKQGHTGRGEGLDLKALIKLRYPALPANQRKIADYLLHHIREAPFLSVVDLERKSGVSRATIVRFSRSLGFGGFLAFRSRLLDDLQSQMSATDIFPLPDRDDLKETLTLVAQQDVRNINQTISHLERDTFTEIATMILKAGRVYTAGLGISSLMAQILAYSLNQVAIRAIPFVHDYETFIEQLAFVTPHDVLIVFSFPPYSRETIDLARIASGRRVPIIALTDRVTSAVSFHAVKTLAIRSHNMLFTNSFSATSVVINALATEVALRNKDKATRMQRQIDKFLRQTGHYAAD
jgi:DNA-binding MurR/RpiR family transcriptional regulator